MEIKWIVICLFLCNWMLLVFGQRGLLFAENLPSETLNFPQLPQSALQGDARPNVLKLLQKPFRYYQVRNVNRIRIFRDGLVTIGGNTVRPGCPKAISQGGPDVRAIAPFWMQSSTGTVTFQEISSASALSAADQQRLLSDINNAFTAGLSASDVTSVVVITWKNLRNARNLHRNELKNTFQLAIVSTASASYVIIVYRVMDVFWVKARDGKNAKCPENAIIGVRAVNRGDDFSLSQFFTQRRDWVAYFSNINDFQNLGRYAMRLTEGTVQPLPPIAECMKNNPDPIICIRSSWFLLERLISESFCKFRNAGVFQYPLACNQLVHCGVGSSSFKLDVCPPGTNFNPLLGNCDFESNFECRFPEQVKVRTRQTVKKKFTRPTAQPIIHNNFCFLQKDGYYPVPNRCDSYLVCNNSRGVVSKCPAGLAWHVSSTGNGFCQHKKLVKCNRKVTTTTTTTTTTATTKKKKYYYISYEQHHHK